MWERSFVAVSVLLGGSVDDAVAALPVGSAGRVAELAGKLKDSRRPVRAQALAVVAQEVAIAIGEVALR